MKTLSPISNSASADLLIDQNAAILSKAVNAIELKATALASDFNISGASYTGYDAFPGLVMLPDGTLYLVVRKAISHVGDKGSIVRMTSDDGGATWSAPVVVQTHATLDSRDPSITLLQNGDIVMSFFRWDISSSQATGPFISISHDNGWTWGAPQNIGTLSGSESTSAVASPAIETVAGTLYLAWYGSTTGRVEPNHTDIHVSKSTDSGQTWTRVGGVAISDTLSEANLIQTSTGLRMMIRNESTNWIMSSTSTDGGVTWSWPANAFSGSASPRLLRSRAGNIYCFYRERVAGVNYFDLGFCWRISQDDGVTWSAQFGSERTGTMTVFCYASAVQLSDDVIGIAYCMQDYVVGTKCQVFFKTIVDSAQRPTIQAGSIAIGDGNLSLNNSQFRMGDDWGNVTFTCGAGFLYVQPTSRMAVRLPVNASLPTLGSDTDAWMWRSGNELYGLSLCIGDNGITSLQGKRRDGNTATYSIFLNPLGGNVQIGEANLRNARLVLGLPNQYGEWGIIMHAGLGGGGIKMLGRPSGSHEGYLSFYDFDGTALLGNVYGIDGTGKGLRFTDHTNTDVLAIASGKAGFGIMPSVRLHVAEQATADAPSLGSYRGGFALTDPYGLYGLCAGVGGSGATWLQCQRFDASTAYNLQLNPAGGNVLIGTQTDSGSRVTIGSPDTGQAGLSVQAGTSADGIIVRGRSGDSVSTISFKESGGTNCGGFGGSPNKIALLDKDGVERFSISQSNIIAIGNLMSRHGNVDSPTLGTHLGGFALFETGGLYGLFTGISGTGTVWFQAQRGDGNTSAHAIALNPSGGDVAVGKMTALYPLDVAGTSAASFLFSPYQAGYVTYPQSGACLFSGWGASYISSYDNLGTQVPLVIGASRLDIQQDIKPLTTDTYSLGDSGKKFKDGFFSGTLTVGGGNSTNWNTAYGWGNHASAGYLTGITKSQVETALDIIRHEEELDVATLAAGSGIGYDIAVTGVANGDLVIVSHTDVHHTGLTIHASAYDGGVFVQFRNNKVTSVSITGTVRLLVIKA